MNDHSNILPVQKAPRISFVGKLSTCNIAILAVIGPTNGILGGFWTGRIFEWSLNIQVFKNLSSALSLPCQPSQYDYWSLKYLHFEALRSVCKISQKTFFPRISTLLGKILTLTDFKMNSLPQIKRKINFFLKNVFFIPFCVDKPKGPLTIS